MAAPPNVLALRRSPIYLNRRRCQSIYECPFIRVLCPPFIRVHRPAFDPEPSVELATKEFLERVDRDDVALLRRRTSGETWEQLAAHFDATPDALRMRRNRLLERFEDEVL